MHNNNRRNNNNRRFKNNGHNNNNKRRFGGGGGSANFDDESANLNIQQRKNFANKQDQYLQKAKDALRNGDRVEAENYYQHADHCFRMMNLGLTNGAKFDPVRGHIHNPNQTYANGENQEGQQGQDASQNSQSDNSTPPSDIGICRSCVSRLPAATAIRELSNNFNCE